MGCIYAKEFKNPSTPEKRSIAHFLYQMLFKLLFFYYPDGFKKHALIRHGFWVQHPFVCPETKNPHKKCSFRTQTSCKWSAHDFNLILVFTALSVHIFTLHFQTLVFFKIIMKIIRGAWTGVREARALQNFQMNENMCVLTSTQPKFCNSSSWQLPGTSGPIAPNLTDGVLVSL